jgi:hypothetical protein
LVQYAAGQSQGSALALDDPAYYAPGRVGIASDALKHLLVKKFTAESSFAVRLWDMLIKSFPELGAATAVDVLTRGGSFRVRQLLATGSGSETDWSLPPCLKTTFDGISSLSGALPTRALLYPSARNAAGFDAILWVPILGQNAIVDFTVAANHGIHEKGLKRLLEVLGWTTTGWPDAALASPTGPVADAARRRIPYVWVVPEDKWDKWTKAQPPKSGTGDADVRAQLVQFALRVPLSPLPPVGGAIKKLVARRTQPNAPTGRRRQPHRPETV